VGADPLREEFIQFTGPYCEIEGMHERTQTGTALTTPHNARSDAHATRVTTHTNHACILAACFLVCKEDKEKYVSLSHTTLYGIRNINGYP
jgi:hypothetical protein